MATKKKIAKQLRELTKNVEPHMIATKYSKGVVSNPYRRLKHAFNKGEVKLNLK